MTGEEYQAEIDELVRRRLVWQRPIIAMRARLAAERVQKDAKPDPEIIHKPTTI